jgi:hypothetical protein
MNPREKKHSYRNNCISFSTSVNMISFLNVFCYLEKHQTGFLKDKENRGASESMKTILKKNC